MEFVYDPNRKLDGFYRCDECSSSFRSGTKPKYRHNVSCPVGSRNPNFATHYIFGQFDVQIILGGCKHGSPLTMDILRKEFSYLLNGTF